MVNGYWLMVAVNCFYFVAESTQFLTLPWKHMPRAQVVFVAQAGLKFCLFSLTLQRYIFFIAVHEYFARYFFFCAVKTVKVILVKIENGCCQNRHYNINILFIYSEQMTAFPKSILTKMTMTTLTTLLRQGCKNCPTVTQFTLCSWTSYLWYSDSPLVWCRGAWKRCKNWRHTRKT